MQRWLEVRKLYSQELEMRLCGQKGGKQERGSKRKKVGKSSWVRSPCESLWYDITKNTCPYLPQVQCWSSRKDIIPVEEGAIEHQMGPEVLLLGAASSLADKQGPQSLGSTLHGEHSFWGCPVSNLQLQQPSWLPDFLFTWNTLLTAIFWKPNPSSAKVPPFPNPIPSPRSSSPWP